MIKVMSFNIRYGPADDGENSWPYRRSLTLARINAFSPDLLGLQECRDDAQAEFLRAGLPDYHFLGIHREGPGETALEMAPLLFRRPAFKLLETGWFWLSETPTIPGSTSWDSAFPRTVTWARLSCRSTGSELTYLNTHFDYQPAAVDGNAQCLRQWLEALPPHTPIVVTGDFNAGKTSAAYRLLTGTGLTDALRHMHSHTADEATFHGFGRPEEPADIDWILVSDHFRIIESQIDRTHTGHLFPSDHYPVTAVLDWKA